MVYLALSFSFSSIGADGVAWVATTIGKDAEIVRTGRTGPSKIVLMKNHCNFEQKYFFIYL